MERLERIEALDRATASPAELLAELRGLLEDAEAWVRVEGGDAADEAVIRFGRPLRATPCPPETVRSAGRGEEIEPSEAPRCAEPGTATPSSRVSAVITHWDEVEGVRRERGHIAASWQSLTGAHSITAGVQRISVEPGRWATPLHLEGSEEEIFYVLSGSGVSYQAEAATEQAYRRRRRRLPRPPRARARAHARARATTGSSCSPSGSATTPPTPCCRGPASPGSARPGCSRGAGGSPLGARGSRRRRRPGTSSPSGRRGSSTSRTCRGEQRGSVGTVGSVVSGSRRRRRIGAHRARRTSSSRRGS